MGRIISMSVEVSVRTSEAVNVGHPDKVADQIADAVLDYLRTFKHNPQSAVEVSCGANVLMIFGEIDREIVGSGDSGERRVEKINPKLVKKIKKIARNKVREIGYDKTQYNPEIVVDLVTQSVEINSAVESSELGASAGDQGIVMGYATNETTANHELHYILPHRILDSLNKARVMGKFPFLLPDAKSQVSVEYRNNNGVTEPSSVKFILLSQSYRDVIDLPVFRDMMTYEVIRIVEKDLRKLVKDERVLGNLLDSLDFTEVMVNPAGPWHDGGPRFDSGLTGRKLVVDNYGSSAPIGGGATAGKNATKVDRSGAYYARHVAKSVVNSGLADRCLVELGFAIGVNKPTSIMVETFGTNHVPIDVINDAITREFDFSVDNLVRFTDSVDSFVRTSERGNYTDSSFPWEQWRKLDSSGY